MSTKNNLAARIGNVAAGVKAERVAVTPRQKPVRLSTDVEPTDYNKLMSLCADIALNVGRVRVSQIWVLRALVLEFLQDKELQSRVTERIRSGEVVKGK